MQNPDKVERLVVLNTPLGLKTKLRPELAAYKNKMAFLRPDPKASPHKPFLFLFDQNCHITLRDHIHSAEVVAFCSCTFTSARLDPGSILSFSLHHKLLQQHQQQQHHTACRRVPLLLQKKRFDGATYSAAGSSYQMQWDIAEGYNIAYQEDDLGSIAVAESMNQVHSCTPTMHVSAHCMLPNATQPLLCCCQTKGLSHAALLVWLSTRFRSLHVSARILWCLRC